MSKILRQFSFSLAVSLLVLLASGTCTAQDFQKDLKRINEAYSSLTGYSMNMTYNLYADATSKKIKEVQKASVSKSGYNLLYTMGDVEVLTTKNHLITIDKDEKLILLNPNSNPQKGGKYLPVDFDSLAQIIGEVDYSALKDNIARYRISLNNSEYEAVEVDFDRSTFYIKKLCLFMRNYEDKDDGADHIGNKPRIEIIFSNLDTKPVFTENFFSESRIVKIKGKTVTAQPAYAHYQVVNNLGKVR